MFQATPQRRKLVVIVLLVLAVVGGAVRHWAPKPSGLRDFGSLLLVLWVPVIGNVIAFFVRKFKLSQVPGFAVDRPFAGQLTIEMTSLVAAPDRLQGDACALVVGTEAFSARLSRPLAGLRHDAPLVTEAEFLHPAMALPQFAEGTPFRVIANNQLVAQGQVLQRLS